MSNFGFGEIHRRPDWEDRLQNYLFKRNRVVPVFKYGQMDCAIWAAGAIRALTGHDLAYGVRRTYNSPASAVRVLLDLGYKSVEDAMDKHFEVIPPAMAHRGDIALYDESLGVVIGFEAMFVGEDKFHVDYDPNDPDTPKVLGLVRVPRPHWTKAWRIPYPGEALVRDVLANPMPADDVDDVDDPDWETLERPSIEDVAEWTKAAKAENEVKNG